MSENNHEGELPAKADHHYYAAEYSQAINLYEEILALNPFNSHAIDYLGRAYIGFMGKKTEERIPREAVQSFRRAHSFIALGNWDIAAKILVMAVEASHNQGVTFSEAEDLLSRVNRQIEKRVEPQ